MVRLGIVAALLDLLLLGEPLRQAAQLRIGLGAGAGQIPECLPHPAGMHLRQIEMRLFVEQDGPALCAVVEDDRLDPGLPRPESGNHPKLEHLTSALPGGVQRVRGLSALRALRRRGSLEVAPSERPPCGPGEGVVCGQIVAQHVVHRTRYFGGRRSPPRWPWSGSPSRRRGRVAGTPKRRREHEHDADSHRTSGTVRFTILPRGGMPASSSKIPTLGGIPNRGAPAPPGFITVTVLSTNSSNGRWLCPKMMISA